MKVSKIKEEDWISKVSSIENKWVNRILNNLTPIIIIDNTLYFQFSGEEENKVQVFEAYKKYKLEIEEQIRLLFNVSNFASGKNIDEIKLKWLEGLVSKFGPSEIKFKLF